MIAAALLLLGLCGHPASGATAAGGEIAADTLWEGIVDVTAEVIVLKGATLLIQPGTVVRFAAGQSGVRLIIQGTLVAQGTAAEPILFTSSAEKPQSSDWGGIVLEKAADRPSRIAHATIRYAQTGIAGSASLLAAEDVAIRDCVRGITVLQEFRGRLSRGSLTGNQHGLYYNQGSGFSVEDSLISGNVEGGVICTNGSSPAIRLSTIADNGPLGVSCIQGSSPLIEGNTIRGHKKGIAMSLQSRPRIFNNIIRENDIGISGEKLVFPTILGNTITENGTGIYCNFSAYPKIHGNNIHANRSFGLVLGDNMSIQMEKKIPFRKMGRFSFERPPEEETELPQKSRRFQPFAASDEGIVDARGNWWGARATQEMALLGAEGNSSAIEDFHDKPDTWYGEEKYPRDRVVFAPWETEPLKDAVPPAKTATGIRGKVVAAGKPLAGVRVHVYDDPSAGFRGPGIVYSAPTTDDGSFFLDLKDGTWYLVAKGPLPPFPDRDPGDNAHFGYYGGNPITVAPGSTVTANIQVIRRSLPSVGENPDKGRSLLEGVVLGPGGPVAGAAVHVYTDAARQFRGPDLFGPQGAVVGGTGEKGEFSVELPPGSYFLVASKRKMGDVLGPLQPGDLHGWYDGNPVAIAAGTRTAVTIQTVAKLRDAAASATPAANAAGVTGIRGKLRDAAGKVPSGVYAFATTDPSFMIGAMPPYRSQPVGADGSFFIELPAAGGTFYVSARSGYGGPPLPGEWHGFYGEAKPAPIVVETNHITSNIDFVIKRME